MRKKEEIKKIKFGLYQTNIIDYADEEDKQLFKLYHSFEKNDRKFLEYEKGDTVIIGYQEDKKTFNVKVIETDKDIENAKKHKNLLFAVANEFELF